MQPYEEYLNVVRLLPENFRDFKSKKEIDRDRLMTVLANVTHLLIRANYNSAKTALYRCVLERRENLRWSCLLYCIVYELSILCIMCFKLNTLDYFQDTANGTVCLGVIFYHYNFIKSVRRVVHDCCI